MHTLHPSDEYILRHRFLDFAEFALAPLSRFALFLGRALLHATELSGESRHLRHQLIALRLGTAERRSVRALESGEQLLVLGV